MKFYKEQGGIRMSETIKDNKYEDLEISESWKEKFRVLEKAGKIKGVTYENNKLLSASERRKIGFNIWALIFTYFYYFSKKMHYKGAFILGAGFLFAVFLMLIETAIGIKIPSVVYWAVPAVIVASIANYDYFKFMTKNEVMWSGFPTIFANIVSAIVFPILSLLLLLMVSGVFPSSGAPKCSDIETTNLVKQIATEKLVGALGQKVANQIKLSVGAIRTTNFNKQTGAQQCAAQLTVKGKAGTKTFDITYKSEKTDDGDEFFVTVYGL